MSGAARPTLSSDVAPCSFGPSGRPHRAHHHPGAVLPGFPLRLPADVSCLRRRGPSWPPRCPTSPGSLGDVERVSWVVVAYLMATTIAAPVYGKLGDVLGRRRLLFVALILFPGGQRAVRAGADHARADSGAGAAGGRRWRVDDTVAGVGGRDRAATGATALPGLPRRHVHGVVHLRAGGGRDGSRSISAGRRCSTSTFLSARWRWALAFRLPNTDGHRAPSSASTGSASRCCPAS